MNKSNLRYHNEDLRYRTDEAFISFVKEHKLIEVKPLLELCRENFPELDITTHRLRWVMHNYNIHSGRDGKFKTGKKPWNAGKKMSAEMREKVSHTWFQKGRTSVNELPLHTERVAKDGYIEIKVSMQGSPHHRWRAKHAVMWEQYHQEKVPANHVVIFLDGDKHNFAQENLVAIPRWKHARLNQKHLRFNDANLTTTAINLIELQHQIAQVKKH